MTRALAMLGLLAAACGGSGPSTANFTGGTWTGTESLTVNCGGQTSSGNSNISLGFAAGAGADLQYTSSDGCVFKFTVNAAGTGATLANAPVTCSQTINGTAVQVTITTYTLSSSDGHHLTTNTSGTLSSQGSTCSFSATGTATK